MFQTIVPNLGQAVFYALDRGPNKGQLRPAIITRVWDPSPNEQSAVQPQIFTDALNDGLNCIEWRSSVLQGESPGQWQYDQTVLLPLAGVPDSPEDVPAQHAKLEEGRLARIVEAKETRVAFDKILQNVKASQRGTHDEWDAVSQVEIHLKEAIMWLGMRLKALDAPNPYPNSYKPENTVVDKTADGLKL